MNSAGAITRARQAAGLSQAALARALGTSRPAISRWERGVVEPSASMLDRILRVCGRRLVIAGVPGSPPAELDGHDLALLEAQLRRAPEDRLAASIELFRLRAGARLAEDR